MKRGFVVSPGDVEQLQAQVLSKLEEEPIVCACFGTTTKSHLAQVSQLEEATELHFVLSRTSASSTAHQILVTSALSAAGNKPCYLLRLDDTKVPLGFEMIKLLPESGFGLPQPST